MVYAGMDVGTSGCKLVAYTLEGEPVYSASRRYQETGTGGMRELDPSMVWENVKDMLAQTGRECPEPIRAMSIASLGETAVFLDKDDRPLMNGMLTGDSRGIEQTQRLIEEKGAQRIFEITGLPPNELYSIPKWMWVRENTDVLEHTDKIFFFEDFIAYKMTGRRNVSYSSAARSLAFDITKKEWSAPMLSMAGISPQQMSSPTAPFTMIGTIRPDLAAELSLPENMKIAVGGHDQTCAAFGSGIQDMKDGECGMGTCEFMFLMLPRPEMTEYMRENDFTCIPYLMKDTFLTSLEITTCGILKNWARDTLFRDVLLESEKEGKNFFSVMDRKAADVQTPVMLLPQFGSSGNPDLSMDELGVICGLSIHTKQEEIYRALLEGMAFQNYLAYERLSALGTGMEKIAATGGGAASDLTLQIRADVFNKKVFTLTDDESGTLGCMMMAAVADGAYKTAGEAISRAVHIHKVFEPDLQMHRMYMKKYERYKDFYQRMHAFH